MPLMATLPLPRKILKPFSRRLLLICSASYVTLYLVISIFLTTNSSFVNVTNPVRESLNFFDDARKLLDRNLSPENYFHAPWDAKIRSLVNASSIISWHVTNDEFFEELDMNQLLPYLDIERIHGRSPKAKSQVWEDTSRYYIWEGNICFAARGFLKSGGVKKHVLFTYVNENRGAFSRDVPNRTANWDRLATHWKYWGCTDEEIYAYLDHPNTRAVVTSQHQSFYHPKVHSIPLGVKFKMKNAFLTNIQLPRQKRKQLLMISDNGWRHRKNLTSAVMANFHHSLKNTYQKGKIGPYVKELRRSKFILAPSGFGWDCYRIWEALYMGTIPIIERYNRPIDGWRRSLDGLPVLWVEHFHEVTPDLLNKKYLEIASNAINYKYEKLTISWWVDFIRSFVPEDKQQPQQLQGSSTTQDGVLLNYYDEGPKQIPCILHFVHVSPGLPMDQPDLPLAVRDNIAGWQQLHSNWTIILWNNAAIQTQFPELVPLLRQIKTMSWVSNLVRYHAMERYGGVYLDTDIVPLQPIDRLRLLRNFSVCEKPASEHLLLDTSDYLVQNCELVNNAVIGAVKHSPALQDVIKTAMENTKSELSNNPNGRYKLITSGPPVWTKSVKRHDLNVLHASLFFPCSWTDTSKCQQEYYVDKPHVYGMHKWSMSWYKRTTPKQ